MPSNSSIADRLHALDAHPIVVASHRRSGTHLMIDLLRKQFPGCRIRKKLGEPLHHLYLTLDNFRTPDRPAGLDDDKALRIVSRAARPIVKTHLILDDVTTNDQLPGHWMRWLHDRATFIYVYRDGRDVLASLYFYMQSFEPSARVPFSQFIRQNDNFSRQPISRPAAWADHVRHWLTHPRVVAVSYERVIHHTEQVLAELGQVIGQPPQMVRPLLPVKPTSIWQVRWQRFFARHPQNTAIVASYKGMKPLRWQHEMTEADRRYFHDQAGDVLLQLGYETSDAWVSRPR